MIKRLFISWWEVWIKWTNIKEVTRSQFFSPHLKKPNKKFSDKRMQKIFILKVLMPKSLPEIYSTPFWQKRRVNLSKWELNMRKSTSESIWMTYLNKPWKTKNTANLLKSGSMWFRAKKNAQNFSNMNFSNFRKTLTQLH